MDASPAFFWHIAAHNYELDVKPEWYLLRQHSSFHSQIQVNGHKCQCPLPLMTFCSVTNKAKVCYNFATHFSLCENYWTLLNFYFNRNGKKIFFHSCVFVNTYYPVVVGESLSLTETLLLLTNFVAEQRFVTQNRALWRSYIWNADIYSQTATSIICVWVPH